MNARAFLILALTIMPACSKSDNGSSVESINPSPETQPLAADFGTWGTWANLVKSGNAFEFVMSANVGDFGLGYGYMAHQEVRGDNVCGMRVRGYSLTAQAEIGVGYPSPCQGADFIAWGATMTVDNANGTISWNGMVVGHLYRVVQ